MTLLRWRAAASLGTRSTILRHLGRLSASTQASNNNLCADCGFGPTFWNSAAAPSSERAGTISAMARAMCPLLPSNGCIVTNHKRAKPAFNNESIFSGLSIDCRKLASLSARRAASGTSQRTTSHPIGPETICAEPLLSSRQQPTLINGMLLRTVGIDAACQESNRSSFSGSSYLLVAASSIPTTPSILRSDGTRPRYPCQVGWRKTNGSSQALVVRSGCRSS